MSSTFTRRLEVLARRRRHRRLLASSTLFDSDWYRTNYPEAATTGARPLDHYLDHGASPRFSPSPLFDARDYLARYPDVAESGVNPLVHYLELGAAEGRVIRALGHNPIAESGLFDSDWYRTTYPDVAAAGIDPIAHFLNQGAIANRSPGPLFDAADYLTQHPDVAASGVNPLVHFLEHGTAEHRSAQSVINESPIDQRGTSIPIRPSHEPASRPSIAVVVHVYYLDVFAEICGFLRNLPYHFNLLITTTSEEHGQSVTRILKDHALDATVFTKHGQNRGRNFGPFLVEFAKLIQHHELLLHLHTKKSVYCGSEQVEWRTHLLKSLLGARPLVYAIINQFVRNPRLGVLYPSTFAGLPYWAHHWLSNRHLAKEYFAKIGLEYPSQPGYFDYPTGSMFWARVKALRPLLAANWSYEDFPPELGQNDGTLAHVIERSIITIAEQQGYGFLELDYAAGCLRENWSRKNLQQYLANSKENLIARIQSADVVSVDIFDTMITRMSLTPDAVQHYLSVLTSKQFPGTEDFFSVRKAAEQSARQKKNHEKDVDIDEIYNAFPSNEIWTRESIALAKQVELDFEKGLFHPRHDVIDAIQFAHSIGKRVVAVSDTYMSQEIVKDILARNGVLNSIDELYLSCERGVRKDRGDMWNLVMEAEGVSKERILHIGDNEHSDIQLPTDRGIPNVHVMNPTTLLVERGFPFTPGKDWQTDIVLGPLAARYGNSPFLPDGAFTPVRLTSAKDLGYCVFGPLFFGFFAWLFQHPVLSRLQRLYFLSREGYFLHKTYEQLRRAGTPEASYFYCSRRVTLSATQAIEFNPSQVIAGTGFRGTIANLLKTRLGLEIPGDFGLNQLEIRLPEDEDYVRKVLEILQDRIQEHARDEIEPLRQYCAETGISAIDPVGIVDIGYRATIQTGLQTILGKGLVGLYLGTLEESEQVIAGGGYAYGCFAEPTSYSETLPPAVKHSRLIEAFLGAPHGQVLRFETHQGRTRPVFGAEGLSQTFFDILAEIHIGAQEYCDDLVNTFGPEVFDLAVDLSACQMTLNMFARHEILIPADVSNALSLEDEFCGNGILDLEECLVPYDRRSN